MSAEGYSKLEGAEGKSNTYFYVHKDEQGRKTIREAEGGVWTWIDANIWNRDAYKLSNVVARASLMSKRNLQALTTGNPQFMQKLQDKVKSYNEKYTKKNVDPDSERGRDVTYINDTIAEIQKRTQHVAKGQSMPGRPAQSMDEKFASLQTLLEKSEHLESEDQLENFLDDFREIVAEGFVKELRFKEDGGNLLHFLAASKSKVLEKVDIVPMLVKKGADFKAKNHNKMTPLLVAIRHGNTPFVFSVLSHFGGRDDKIFTAANSEGETALHLLFARSSPIPVDFRAKIADRLCLYGADINARNAKGDTPLDVVERYGASDLDSTIIGTLRRLGARRSAELPPQQPPGSPSDRRI